MKPDHEFEVIYLLDLADKELLSNIKIYFQGWPETFYNKVHDVIFG